MIFYTFLFSFNKHTDCAVFFSVKNITLILFTLTTPIPSVSVPFCNKNPRKYCLYSLPPSHRLFSLSLELTPTRPLPIATEIVLVMITGETLSILSSTEVNTHSLPYLVCQHHLAQCPLNNFFLGFYLLFTFLTSNIWKAPELKLHNFLYSITLEL